MNFPSQVFFNYINHGYRAAKSIVHVIKHANFQLYRVHPEGVI